MKYGHIMTNATRHLRCYRVSQERRGTVLVKLAILLPVLMGFMGLTIDGGMMLSSRRQAQNAADAAALAAAQDLMKGHSHSTAMGSANRYIQQVNGLPNATSLVEGTTFNIPPTSGPFAGNNDYVAVIVEAPYPSFFMQVLTGESQPTITARAVATWAGDPVAWGLIALDRHEDRALRMTGSGTVEVVGGSIYVNSDSNRAFSLVGSGNAIADSFEIVGDVRAVGSAELHGTVNNGASPVADPLLSLPEPDPGDYIVRAGDDTRFTGSSSHTILPGVYEGGIKLTGSGSLFLQPGIYIMKGGGFEVTGSGSVTGNGVMIYNMSGGDPDEFKLTGSGSITLTPPTSGPYENISVFQERSMTDEMTITGSGNLDITGVVYTAGASLKLTGSGSTDVYGGAVIANTIRVTGSGRVAVDTTGMPQTNQAAVSLVE